MADLICLSLRANQGKRGTLAGIPEWGTFRPTPIGLTPNFLFVDPNEKTRCTFHQRLPILGEIPPLEANAKALILAG
jgi:hypothetical protein